MMGPGFVLVVDAPARRFCRAASVSSKNGEVVTHSHEHTYSVEGPWQVGVVILGGGQGERLGHGPKALIDLGGKPLLRHVLDAVLTNETISAIAVTAPEELVDVFSQVVEEAESTVAVSVVPGGRTRQASAAAGLASLSSNPDWVAVTDAARPFTPHRIIDCLLSEIRNVARRSAAAKRPCGVVPVLPIIDSVHVMGNSSMLAQPIDRSSLRAAQTPQVFYRECLATAYERAVTIDDTYTDEAGLASRSGAVVITAPGEWSNFKITYPFDLTLARSLVPHVAATRIEVEYLA